MDEIIKEHLKQIVVEKLNRVGSGLGLEPLHTREYTPFFERVEVIIQTLKHKLAMAKTNYCILNQIKSIGEKREYLLKHSKEELEENLIKKKERDEFFRALREAGDNCLEGLSPHVQSFLRPFIVRPGTTTSEWFQKAYEDHVKNLENGILVRNYFNLELDSAEQGIKNASDLLDITNNCAAAARELWRL